ncbi:GMC oxidoreductase [Bacillus sp. AFS073361]|uniref:GMC oxidoreductase n=1 Tax=Bacillus sp. AFS073361 TaxID=2033511 RepID=UPI0027BA34F3|nr:GMC oxidoreductase [Bacillus sp. AFS073361]
MKGVVDSFLNVFGTKNLKVADLSIAPILPDGNTSIPLQMIGLNAVRFIQNNPHPKLSCHGSSFSYYSNGLDS